MKTLKCLSIHRKISIKFWILTFQKLPKRRSNRNNSSKKCSFMPIIWIERRILINCLTSIICCQKCCRNNWEKFFLYFRISINRGNKSIFWIKFCHFFIFLDRIGNIGTLYFSLSFEVFWMHNIDNPNSRIFIFFYNILRMFSRCWNARLSRKQNGNIFTIAIFRLYQRDYIIFNYISWLSINRHNHDVFEIFRTIFDEFIFRKICFFNLQKSSIRFENMMIASKNSNCPIRNIKSDEK